MAEATHYVDPPRRLPRRGGIRSVAEFRDGGNRLGLGGLIEFTSPGCQIAVGDARLCYPVAAPAQAEKTRSGIDTLGGIGTLFGAYAGVECWMAGDDYDAIALRLLEQGEDRAIEAALDTWLMADTPVAATSLAEAIAAAEDHADATYVGLPVLVMNRGDAVRAKTAGALEDDKKGGLWTPNGTPVLASASITAGNVSVTGGITVIHTEYGSQRVQDWQYNKEYAIAERVYGLIVDCEFVARYNITAP
jgi:hypothetical protein